MVKRISNEQILCHRGKWSHPNQKNSLEALKTALSCGYGLETDLRDALGKIVVSHDPVFELSQSLQAEALLEAVAGSDNLVALNLKSDGLTKFLRPNQLPKNYFFFDMSIPEALLVQASGFKFAERLSEFEKSAPLCAPYVWIDCFKSEWMFSDSGLALLDRIQPEVQIVFVSPELHQRDPRKMWAEFRRFSAQREGTFICTDLPDEVPR